MCKCSFILGIEMRFFFFPPHLWFNYVRKTEEQLVWCQFGRPLSLLFIPPTPPDILLLVMPSFSFKPAILLSVRENFPDIWGLQELFSFYFQTTLFLNANPRMSFLLSFKAVAEALC